MEKLPLRSEIDRKYRWRLEDLYETDARWEEDFARMPELIARVSGFRGTLKESGAQMDDPARFAMVELVNLHDESLAFEPIHRLLLGADVQDLAGAFAAWLEQHPGPGGRQTFCLHANGRVYDFETARGAHTLPVGTLQGFLDEYLQAHPQVQIDYIHDDDALLRLAAKPGHAGFLLPPIGKDAFFAGVAQCGALPRKTFSMGVSRDKRYYLEARKIIR